MEEGAVERVRGACGGCCCVAHLLDRIALCVSHPASVAASVTNTAAAGRSSCSAHHPRTRIINSLAVPYRSCIHHNI